MNMSGHSIHHSVTLIRDKCMGCTHCLQRCPTQAIRIENRRARIIGEKCIDCGECIRVCPYHAMTAVTDPLEAIRRFPYKIALPDPVLYGQFKGLASVGRLLSAFPAIGFDGAYDVARAADYLTVAMRARLQKANCPRPLISSSCPTVVRLIQTRFPELLDHVVDLKAPVDVAAEQAKRLYSRESGVPLEDIGCFFITPCTARMTAIKNPLGHAVSAVDGAISMLDLYGLLRMELGQPCKYDMATDATAYGVGWACSGGELRAAGIDSALAVDGIGGVIGVLEEIENGKLSDLRLFEGKACSGGCVGGPLAFENGYVAMHRINGLMARLPGTRPEESVSGELMQALEACLTADLPIAPVDVTALDADMGAAMEKMRMIESLTRRLPGLDCGSCGSPTCRAHAEDVASGLAGEIDCLHLLTGHKRGGDEADDRL